MARRWAVVTAVFLITGVAHHRSGTGTEGTANGGTFKATAGLVADDATQGGSAQTTHHRTTLGLRSGRLGAAGHKKGADGGGGKSGQSEGIFHG